MATSRIFPLNWTTGAGGVVDTDAVIPMAAIQSITMSIRVSDGDFAIGYIQELIGA